MATISLVSGPIKSGKTTMLKNWCANRSDAGGLLSPVINQKRFFRDVMNGAIRCMEAQAGETEVQEIGRYTFSTESFVWANQLLLNTLQQPALRFLIIDEIGPLELQEKGLHPALQVIFRNLPPHLNLVLVIREQLAEKVLDYYSLQNHNIRPFHFPEQIFPGFSG